MCLFHWFYFKSTIKKCCFHNFPGQFQGVLHGCILRLLQRAEVWRRCEERESLSEQICGHVTADGRHTGVLNGKCLDDEPPPLLPAVPGPHLHLREMGSEEYRNADHAEGGVRIHFTVSFICVKLKAGGQNVAHLTCLQSSVCCKSVSLIESLLYTADISNPRLCKTDA